LGTIGQEFETEGESKMRAMVWIQVLVLIVLVVVVQAQESQEKQKSEKQKIQELYADAVQKANQQITSESVAVKLKLVWPVKEPSAAIKDIREEQEKKFQSRAETECPMPDASELKQEIGKKFPAWSINDKVEFVLARGGPNSWVSGTLYYTRWNLILSR